MGGITVEFAAFFRFPGVGVLFGLVFSIIGVYLYATAKGRHFWWCFLGLFSIFGTIPALITLAVPVSSSRFRRAAIAGGVVIITLIGFILVAISIPNLSYVANLAKARLAK